MNGCENLISGTIPDSVIIIIERAFDGCGLVNITIGNSDTMIEQYAFIWCRSLAAAYCKPITPPTVNSNMLNGNDPTRNIYMPRNLANEMY